MKAFLYIIPILLFLQNPREVYAHTSAKNDSVHFKLIKVPEYTINERPNQIILEMEYAHATILNPEAWQKDRRRKKVKQVDLIFTDYPENREDWLTNYDTLLNQRIQALEKLIPQLAQDSLVKWNLVLQTACTDAKTAESMFHGAVVKYHVKLSKQLRNALANVRRIVTGQSEFEDSVVYKVFDRNTEWENVLVVNDWTGSMYDYGAQAVLWHRLNMEHPHVKHFVFFNDGNQKKNHEKTIGETGGIFTARADSLREIITVMREVMVSGQGGDDEENDLEALLRGIMHYPDANEVVLIADNKSGVRDMALLSKIDMPIRIVLCGIRYGQKIHDDYLKLAFHSKGSIHTVNEDIMAMTKDKNGKTLEIMGVLYKIENGKLVMISKL